MDNLICLLIDNANNAKQEVTKKLKQYNVTCRQAVVLKVISNDAISAKNISELCDMDKATLSLILSKLASNGYVEQKTNNEDKRENIYSITQKGIDILPIVESAENEYRNKILTKLSDKEYNQLLITLGKMN